MTQNFNNLLIWREQVCRHLLKLDFKPSTDGPFRAELSDILDAGPVRVVHWSHSPGYTSRDRDLVRDGVDSMTILLARKTVDIVHQNRELRLRPGEVTLMNNCEPGQIASSQSANFVALLLPPKSLGLVGARLDQLVAQRWRPSPALDLLKSYVDCLKNISGGLDGDLAVATSQHLVELVRQAASTASGKRTIDPFQPPWHARVQLAQDYLARNFSDPNLSEAIVAAAQGIGTRQLQKVFERSGTRFTEQVSELRLAAAYQLLIQNKTDIGVLEIAMAVGFRDISHFNRTFRRRFNATPSMVRRMGVQ